MRSRTSLGRMLAAGALLLGSTACLPMDTALQAIFGRSMRDQNSFDPYENPLPPPEGAVAFSSGNFPAEAGQVNIGHPAMMAEAVPAFTQREMVPPGADVVRTLVNPVPADEVSLARGEVMYNRYCTVCHGADGIGANAPLAPKHPALPAFNLAGPQVAGYTDGYIYGMIRVGRGIMPAYGHRVPHFDRWNIVNYIRQLQGGATGGAPADSAAATPPAGGAR